MSSGSTFDYSDFHFTVLSSTTCMIGLNNGEDANAPKSGKSYSDVLRIPEYAYNGQIRYKVIETSRFCFRYCTNLVTAYLPRTLKKINEDMFYETGVTSLVVPRSVEILDFAAFSQMTKLKSLVFEPGSKISIIGRALMNKCYEIRKIVLPSHVASIGNDFFWNVPTTTVIDVYYCGVNKITESIFTNGGNVITHVTKDYPADTYFGGIQPNIISDDSCKSFLEYENVKSCNCIKRNTVNHLYFIFWCFVD